MKTKTLVTNHYLDMLKLSSTEIEAMNDSNCTIHSIVSVVSKGKWITTITYSLED